MGGIPKNLCKIGVWNVRGVNEGWKRSSVIQVMRERKYDVLALSETKLKGNGLIEWDGMKGVKAGVGERGRAREGVAVLMKEIMWQDMVEYKAVNSRIIWVKVRVSGSLWVFVAGYAPSGSCSEEKRDFWWKVDEVLNGFGREVKVLLLGDLNAKIGRVMIEGVTGNEHKDIHKYTWVGDGERGGRSMLDYIIVDERLRKGLEDVRVRRGVGAGMSDHMMVVGKINLGSQRKVKDSQRVMGKKVKVEKLREASVRREYCRKVEEGLREHEGRLGENVEAMWRVVNLQRKFVGSEKLVALAGRQPGGGMKRLNGQ